MANGVLECKSVMAKDVDSLNRSAKSSADINNGYVFRLEAQETGDGETELWTVVQPATNYLESLWMAGSPDIVLTDSKYKGIDPDPRNFTNVLGYAFDAFKPQPGDIITLSADAFSGSANDFANAANGEYTLAWGAAATADALALRTVAVTTMVIGLGTIATQKVLAYKMEVLTN